MSYPSDNTPIPTYAGTALQGDIDHAGWHGITNIDVDGIKSTLGTTSGTSVLKDFTSGDFCAKSSDIPTVPTKASSSDINTGTDDAKFATSKAIEDSYIGKYFFNPNVIINSGFTVNQRVYVSNATLAAGVYGHDRWKAGSGGGDYTFTQLASPTTITIKTGKTLIQVIEDKNIGNSTYILSWTGTARARLGIDSATPSGSYDISPLTITTQTPGTVMSVEFNEGTLGNVLMTPTDIVLPYFSKSFPEELELCQRYCIAFNSIETASRMGMGFAADTTHAYINFSFPTTMRTVPTLVATAADWQISDDTSVFDLTAMAIIANINSMKNVQVYCTVASGLTAFRPYVIQSDGNIGRLLYFQADL